MTNSEHSTSKATLQTRSDVRLWANLCDIFTFIKQGLIAAKTTGTVAPSSRALALYMVETSQLALARTIVEFGPGTGAITEVILENAASNSIFLAIEINPEFATALRKKYPALHIFEDSAANVQTHLNELSVNSCDCIISGLPWALFEEPLQTQILDAAWNVLAPGGRFVTFTYFFSLWTRGGKRFRHLLNTRFNNHVELSPIIWQNFPPARVYCATKLG